VSRRRPFRSHGRVDRAVAANILLALDAGTPLHDALAEALHDPTLEIVYRLGERAGWVDDEGRDVEEPCATPGRAVTMIERNGRRIAALVHDPALAEETATIELVASAAGLPLENTRLQADLRSQFQFLVTLVNTAPSLIVHLDTEGRIVSQNVAAVEAAGVDDEEEIRGRHFWDVFIDPLLREDVVRRFREAAPVHPAVEYEDTFVNRRGERRVVFWRSAPLLDERGRTRGIIAGGIDITARHEEAEGRERERVFLNAIANEAPSLLCLIDERGVLAPEASNKSFERTLEVEPHETGGTVFWDTYVAPEDSAPVRALIARVAGGETVGYNDHTWITKSGRRISVSWSCIRLPSIDERRLLLVSGVDVTERKQREIQLQRERDITSTLMSAIPSIVCVVDREGMIVDSGVDPARAAVNEAFRDALGWPDEAIVRSSVLDLIDAGDGYFARMAIASAANGVASAQRETRWRRADGGDLVIAWTATPVADVTGREPSLVLVSGVDVTERRQQEEEIRASRTRIIEAADEARRVLERNLHDGAQQRLVALSVSLRLAESRAAADPAATEAIIRAAREELAAALEELRELARGIHPAVLTDRGLAAAVEALVVRTPFPVTVTMPQERLPAPLEAAAYYVVAESVTNIVKYAGATTVDVTVEAGESLVTVTVTDDGCGGADPDTGTGLRGLRDRVAALDGTLEVDSPTGQGTRVVARIPLAPRPEPGR
jgi:PAS domain S-box-containing protein